MSTELRHQAQHSAAAQRPRNRATGIQAPTAEKVDRGSTSRPAKTSSAGASTNGKRKARHASPYTGHRD